MDVEEEASLASQELDFHAAIMQEAYNEVMERPEGNPSQHYFRGSVKEAAEDANSIYSEALQIMELQSIFNLGQVEEMPEEEVRLAKEKYFAGRSHGYTGSIGEAMDSHTERVFEARKSDIIGNDNGFHHLRASVARYEELIQEMIGASSDSEDAEIIGESEDTIEVEEIDHLLGKNHSEMKASESAQDW